MSVGAVLETVEVNLFVQRAVEGAELERWGERIYRSDSRGFLNEPPRDKSLLLHVLWGHILGFGCVIPPDAFHPFHAEEPPREPPEVDLRPLQAVLPSAKSIRTIKRLLRVWSPTPVEHLDDFVSTSITGGMRRGEPSRRPEGPGTKRLGSALHAPG